MRLQLTDGIRICLRRAINDHLFDFILIYKVTYWKTHLVFYFKHGVKNTCLAYKQYLEFCFFPFTVKRSNVRSGGSIYRIQQKLNWIRTTMFSPVSYHLKIIINVVRMRLSPSRDQGEGESRWLQSATRPLRATKSYTQWYYQHFKCRVRTPVFTRLLFLVYFKVNWQFDLDLCICNWII